MHVVVCACLRTKKVSVPVALFSQVLSKNSSILTAIKQATNTQIDMDKHAKQSTHRVLTVRYDLAVVVELCIEFT